MVRQGAKNILFPSRSGAKKPEAKKAIEELAGKGVKVTAYSCDVGNAQEVEEVLRQCAREYPPIRDVVQRAMMLKIRH
jgi:NAD(P)-dependent dehydrogenase (short-subunit alcohol dehydrogenase family)